MINYDDITDDVKDFLNDHKGIKAGLFLGISVFGIFLLGKVFKITNNTIVNFNALKRSLKDI